MSCRLAARPGDEVGTGGCLCGSGCRTGCYGVTAGAPLDTRPEVARPRRRYEREWTRHAQATMRPVMKMSSTPGTTRGGSDGPVARVAGAAAGPARDTSRTFRGRVATCVSTGRSDGGVGTACTFLQACWALGSARSDPYAAQERANRVRTQRASTQSATR